MKILTVEQMRRAEQVCAAIGIPSSVLMENAGKAVAEETRRILGALDKQHILFLIGPGNNGGDGLVAARYLHDWGVRVSLYLFGKRDENDRNFDLVNQRSIFCLEAAQDTNMEGLDDLVSSATTMIDALFGIGKSRPLGGIFAQTLEIVRKAKEKNPHLRIIALDLPSGLDADSGAVDPACIAADNTITLGFPKPGLFNLPGAARAGKITIVDIGIPANLVEGVTTELLTDEWAKSVLPDRPLVANKGSFGRVLVVAGSNNYIGAAYLACSGALRVGAGLVTLATATSLQPILASKLTEVTYLPLPESSPGIVSQEATRLLRRELGSYNVLLAGCGLGQSPQVSKFIKAILLQTRTELPSLVLDADALNILAKTRRWWHRLAGDAILTPHPGEMARLTGVTVDAVQSNRMGIAKKIANEFNKTVVLKGAYTVIAAPDGRCCVSPMANPGLASAGTGDVLAGTIAGLRAQGLNLFDAAACGVYLHGKAGEIVRDRLGDAGMTASDLPPVLPLAIKQLQENG
ncbi:MAG: NAD(P)H-hydrate dehydratase [Chloroflexi bacterium]|nr:NAD(P)H-hydrate dehydratase [Chloroflexota bacterium]